jgi:hypothetical protein
MSFNFRLEHNVIDVQLTKVLRCAYKTDNLNEVLLDSLKYFIYDLWYILHAKNYVTFENFIDKPCELEANSDYVFSVLGSKTDTPFIGPFQGELISTDDQITKVTLRIGDVLEINVKDPTRFVFDSGNLILGFRVTKSENLENTAKLKFFRQLVSKQSWTNHFPCVPDC